jgi:hypothetical protein
MKNLSLIAALTAGATGLSLAFAPSSQAIQYNLRNVDFSGTDSVGAISGNVTGSFFFDGSYSNVSIEVTGTGGDASTDRYDAIYNDTSILAGSDVNVLFLNFGTSPNTDFRRLRLNFLDSLTGIPGQNVDITGFVRRGNGASNQTINLSSGGSVQAVPLDANSLPLVVSGLFLGGGVWFKRKRSQVKVSEFIANKS